MSKAPHINVPVQATKAIDALATSRICGLADAGEIEQAAASATLHFVNGAYAIAPFAVWLAAGFARGGPNALPHLLKQAAEQLRADQVARPEVMADWNRSLNWLADNVRSRVRFHAKFHDQDWKRWCASLTSSLEQELDDACSALSQSMSAAHRGEADEILHGLTIVIRRTFGPLIPVSVVTPDVEDEGEDEDQLEAAEPLALHEAIEPSATTRFEPSERTPVVTESARLHTVHVEPDDTQPTVSSAMRALQAKLRAFDKLAHEQAWPLAAMVARDIERELSQFDPVRYFPQYFSKYLNTLCAVGGELELHMQPADSLEGQALERLYHADPERFLLKINTADAKG